jgi:hypothetical protein
MSGQDDKSDTLQERGGYAAGNKTTDQLSPPPPAAVKPEK